jgi:hypothetical protein
MTRTMGDATGSNAAALEHAGTNMVAGYVTGTGGIPWTAGDWGLFFGKVVVTIDQGASGSPVPPADVRDVEAGAWTVGAAVNRAGWTATRPTIYCSASTLGALEQAGWKGDVWVADWTYSPPAAPYPVPAGMTCVAVQYTDKGGGGAYDLSVVFDDTWPGWSPVPAPPVTSWQEDMMRLLPTLAQGSTGADVRSIQGLCTARGHAATVDGVFGPLTSAAVKAVQAAAGISTDGVVGPQTWPALMDV